jgi:tRNA(fMet)-specific endonuclease VapC
MTEAILDTDILSEFMKGKHLHVMQHAYVYELAFGSFSFSIVTRYEVRRGLRRTHSKRLLGEFDAFTSVQTVLPITDRIWRRTEDLWLIAQRGGFPSGDADLLIAATALEHQRQLVTGNVAHFHWIPNLSFANWRLP